MPISAFDLWPDGTARPAPDLAPAGPGSLRWLHFELRDPALPEWCAAHLPGIPGQSLMQSETRPRCDVHDTGLILNLRGVNLNPGAEAAEMISLRMWVTRATIVTVRLHKTYALDAIRADCGAGHGPGSAGAFLTRLVTSLTRSIRDEVMSLAAAAEALEDQADSGALPGEGALKAPRRDVLKLHRYMGPQCTALSDLQDTGLGLFAEDELLHLREATNIATLSAEALGSLSARLAVLQDHLDAALARQLARNSYLLSVIAALFLPLGLITGLLGVNLGGIPGAASPLAFPLLCLGLLVLGGGMLLIMRWLKLL